MGQKEHFEIEFRSLLLYRYFQENQWSPRRIKLKQTSRWERFWWSHSWSSLGWCWGNETCPGCVYQSAGVSARWRDWKTHQLDRTRRVEWGGQVRKLGNMESAWGSVRTGWLCRRMWRMRKRGWRTRTKILLKKLSVTRNIFNNEGRFFSIGEALLCPLI